MKIFKLWVIFASITQKITCEEVLVEKVSESSALKEFPEVFTALYSQMEEYDEDYDDDDDETEITTQRILNIDDDAVRAYEALKALKKDDEDAEFEDDPSGDYSYSEYYDYDNSTNEDNSTTDEYELIASTQKTAIVSTDPEGEYDYDYDNSTTDEYELMTSTQKTVIVSTITTTISTTTQTTKTISVEENEPDQFEIDYETFWDKHFTQESPEKYKKYIYRETQNKPVFNKILRSKEDIDWFKAEQNQSDQFEGNLDIKKHF